MCARQRISEILALTNFPEAELRISLLDGFKCLLDSGVYGVEVDDNVFLFVLDIS